MTSVDRRAEDFVRRFARAGAGRWQSTLLSLDDRTALEEFKHVREALASFDASDDPDAFSDALELALRTSAESLPDPYRAAAMAYLGFTKDTRDKSKTDRERIAARHLHRSERWFRTPSLELPPTPRDHLLALVYEHFVGGSRLVQVQGGGWTGVSLEANVPIWPNGFVGRAHEISRSVELLQHTDLRLLSVTGAPGVGKTRFVGEVARALTAFPDGVWFVNARPVLDWTRLPEFLLKALRVDVGQEPAGRRLGEYIGSRGVLMALDGFEHLIPARQVLVDLLRACPRLKLVVTTQRLLGVSEEFELRLMPLDPIAGRVLLRQRTSERTGVPLEQEALDPTVVDRLAEAAEGLPLALELVAAQASALEVSGQLTADQASASDVLGAHLQTDALRRTFDWSYGLLAPEQAHVFRQLGVFADTFDLELASAVCEEASASSGSLGRHIGTLASCSMVQPIVHRTVRGVTLLRPLRVYARELLVRENDAEARQRQLVQAVLALSDEAAQGLRGPQQVTSLDRLEMLFETIRSVLLSCADAGAWDDALRIASALSRYWEIRGPWVEGREWLTRCLDASALQDDTRAWAYFGLARLAYCQDDMEVATVNFEAALANARMRRNRSLEAVAMTYLAMSRWSPAAQHDEHADAFEASVQQARDLGDSWALVRALNALAMRLELSNPHRSQGCLRHALEISIAEQDLSSEVETLVNLGDLLLHDGHLAEAADLLDRALQAGRRLGYQRYVAFAELNLGFIAVFRGDAAMARGHLAAALELSRAFGERRLSAAVFACSAALAEQPVRAALLIGAARRVLIDLKDLPLGAEQRALELTRSRHQEFPDADWVRLVEDGERLPPSAANALAHAEVSGR